jgi:hypothetical protein
VVTAAGRVCDHAAGRALRDRYSLDTLSRQAREMAKHTGLRFEDAPNELVRDLNKQELESIIAEAVSRYGKEIVCNEQSQY